MPRLQPEELHRLILDRGLEDSGDLIAAATSVQIARVFDLDLWRPDHAGGDERLDGTRFGEWLEVLAENGTAGATLAGVDAPVVIAAFAQHVRVFDRAVVDPYMSLDGDLTPTGYASDERTRCDIGGYTLFARRGDAWDAVTSVLTALAETHGDFFDRVMRGCVRLSDTGREIDGLDDLLATGDQALFQLAVDREERRAADGYLAPARARVFLERARRGTSPAGAHASDPGLLPAVRDGDPLKTVNEGLALLANALIAGTGIQGRRLTPDEATRAALAVCTLGFENWPGGQAPRPDDLTTAFHTGWTRLHEDVCMYAADRLLAVLVDLRAHRSVGEGGPRHDLDTELALRSLRTGLTTHLRAGTPWRVRESLDVLAPFDLPSWAALRGLIDELPVLPAAVHACLTATAQPVSATAFEFISSNAQIRLIHDFVDSLGSRLGR